MEMEEEQPAEVVFRASKRRKVARKPGLHDREDEALRSSTEDAAINKPDLEEEQNVAGGVARVQRKGGVRKLGIGFSSADTFRNGGREQSEELALVPVSENDAPEVPTIDRFVKPTGRVGVTEDKHMMAYVDSKLAEARPVADAPPTSAGFDLHTSLLSVGHEEETDGNDPSVAPATEQSHPPHGGRTYQQAQERSTRAYQRPTKRRQPPPREQTDVARDSMIDLIMGENQVPHYDRSAPQTQDDEDELAQEEAFKERLLADLARNKRRPPLQKSAASIATGPKLGGSRAARERMRAIEEAKGSSGKK